MDNFFFILVFIVLVFKKLLVLYHPKYISKEYKLKIFKTKSTDTFNNILLESFSDLKMEKMLKMPLYELLEEIIKIFLKFI